MVLTDRQRVDLHAGIYEYLCSQGPAFQKVAEAFAEADPAAAEKGKSAATASSGGATSNGTSGLHVTTTRTTTTPLLEKKWTAIPRLQKKVLELERQAAHNAKIHAHRSGVGAGGATDGSSSTAGPRRMLPRLPCTHTLQGHSSVVTCVQVHPLFTIVVSGSEDGTVKVWDHESGEYIRTLKGHTNTVNAVSFSPTGSHLVSCSTDLSIKLWDFTDYVCLRTLRGHDHTISSVIFLPQESIFTEAMNGGGGRNKSTTTSSTSSGAKSGIAATAGAQCLLSASRDQTVKLWDVETGFCDHTFTDHGDWVRCLAARHSNGGIWASAGNDPMICVYDYKTKIAELRGHEHVVEALAFITQEPFKESSSSGTTSSTAAALSSSSSVSSNKSSNSPANASTANKQNELLHDYLASGSRDRTVRLWRVSEQTCIAVFRAHENWVRSVLIHPSGNYIISSSDDKSIRVFDIKAVRCLRTLDNAHDHFISSLHMHHTLPILVSGSVDQTVRCWQLD